MEDVTQDDLADDLTEDRGDAIQLNNHRTGWNLLTRLWDQQEEVRKVFIMMNYGFNMTRKPLDFSRREFGIRKNGKRGKMPMTRDEWCSVGLQ
jgi:hypothetical protein